jgi:tetratricopeptide (TPR) repeat protein
MSRSSRKDNFIDKTFTILANGILRSMPTPKAAKVAFAYYRDGLNSQSEGEYSEALNHYYNALRLETDPFDRSYIFYNIRLIHSCNGRYSRALEYYFAALDRNPMLAPALNNIAILFHSRGEDALRRNEPEIATLLFYRSREYWKECVRLSPWNYSEAENWLQFNESTYLARTSYDKHEYRKDS